MFINTVKRELATHLRDLKSLSLQLIYNEPNFDLPNCCRIKNKTVSEVELNICTILVSKNKKHMYNLNQDYAIT